MDNDNTVQSKKSPLMWVVALIVVVVIAVVVLGVSYYLIMANQGGGGHKAVIPPSDRTAQVTSPTVTVAMTPENTIYTSRPNPIKGTYLADSTGMTLYIYSKDTPGVSNCVSTCLVNWPPYTPGATTQKTLPANISVITRADGSKQFTWKNMPLYYFKSDTIAGQITGDGVGGFTLAR
jgi:predicted lipoprotein with Yx(FWY)xxD motif